jgi:hypothetical protein
LNQDGANAPATGYPGEEHVPPAFRARPLPPDLAQARQLLLGNGPDRAYLNYRLRELLGTLHAGELGPYVLALDPRVTYLPFKGDLFALAALGARITTLVNTGQQLSFVGPRWPVPYGNRLLFDWQLTVLDAATLRLAYFDPGSNAVVTPVLPYTTSGGLSSPVLLPGSTLAVRFTAGTGGSWQVEALARPAQRLPEVAANVERGLTDELELAVFGPPDVAEPFRTFRNCWRYHDQFPYRLGGYAIALAYRLGALGG